MSLGANLARREAPFSLTIFILGGGGFFETEADYTPGNGAITCKADLGITVSASLAIALGPIKGGVYVYLGITATFSSGQNSSLTMGVIFLLHGEVSVLSIVSASITLLLEANYYNGSLIGHGRLTISIKICWCFTLNVNEEVTWHLAGGSSGQSTALPPSERYLLAMGPRGVSPADSSNPVAEAFGHADPFTRVAHMYVFSLI